MPWVKNNNSAIKYDVNIFSVNRIRETHQIYRSRINIKPVIFRYISAGLHLTLASDQPATKYFTYALARGEETENIIENTLNGIEARVLMHGYSRHVLIYNTSNNQGIVADIETALREDDWTEHNFTTALITSPSHVVSVYTKTIPGTHEITTVVLTNVYSNEAILKLGAVLPIIYGKEVPEALTNAFLNGDKQAFIDALYAHIVKEKEERAKQELAERFEQLSTMLNNMGTNQYQNSISSLQNDIDNYNNTLRDLYEQLKDLQIRNASTYWEDQQDVAGEFISYLKDYGTPFIERMMPLVGPLVLRMEINTTLSYWEPEIFTDYYNSSRGNLITSRPDSQQKLLHNIFIDKSIEVLHSTAIRIRFNSNEVMRDTDFRSDRQPDMMPHPHIHYYNCWGDNLPIIIKALNNKEYIGAWEQIKATLSGLNLTDYTVLEKFLQDMFNNYRDRNVLRIVDTGERISPNSFLSRYPDGYKKEEA